MDQRRGRECEACGVPLERGDRHHECVLCLGAAHTARVLHGDESCPACASLDISILRARWRAARDDERKVSGLVRAPAQPEHVFAVPRVSARGRGLARSAPATHAQPCATDVGPAASGRSLAGQRYATPAATSTRVHASSVRDDSATFADGAAQTEEDDYEDGEWLDDEDYFDDEDLPRVRSVYSASSVGRDDDAASTTSTAAKADSVVEIFQTAMDRIGLTMPETEAAPPTPGSEPLPGERAEQPVRAKRFRLPTVRGVAGALHFTWKACKEEKDKEPERHRLPIEMCDWAALGLGKLPQIEPKLAKCLESRFSSKSTKNPYHVAAGRTPTFHDKAAKKAVQQNAASYDRASKIVQHLNASALLIGSLSHVISGELAGGDPPSPQEMLRLTELLASLNRYTLQHTGALLGSFVRQERDRWTDPVDLRTSVADVNDELRRLKISPDTLFPGGYEVVKAASDECKETATMVSAVAEEKESPATADPTPPKRDRRDSNASVSSPPPVASTPVPAPTQYRGRGGGRGGYRGGYRGGRSFYTSSRYTPGRYSKGYGKEQHK